MIPLFLVFLLFPLSSDAREPYSKVGTTGFACLKLPADARSAALGGGGTALRGVPPNPACLAGESRWSLSYGDYLMDIHLGEAGMTYPLGGRFSFGLRLLHLSYGELTKVDRTGNAGGTFGAGDFSLYLTAAGTFGWGFSLGAGLRAIYSYIGDYTADAYALDLGFLWRAPWKRTSFGLALVNVGFVRKGYRGHKDALPVALRAGFSHLLAHLPVVLVGEAVLPNDNLPYLSGGGEAYIGRALTLRLGYDGRAARDSEDKYGGLSVGFGLVLRGVQLDYAYSLFGELGEVHRVSLSGRF